MTAVKTMQIRIVHPQAERLLADLASQNYIEIDAPETPPGWYDRFCCEFIEHQKQDGTPPEKLITVAEIVAVCKEARAERYTEEQEQKKSACR